MSGYRLSAQLRELHDMAECPDSCTYCRQIDALEDRARGGRDYEITTDYEEYK